LRAAREVTLSILECRYSMTLVEAAEAMEAAPARKAATIKERMVNANKKEGGGGWERNQKDVRKVACSSRDRHEEDACARQGWSAGRRGRGGRAVVGEWEEE
jgi:hypothetical protein